jgi:hypothetical protein
MYVCVRVYVYVYVCVCACGLCTYACVHAYVCVHVCVCFHGHVLQTDAHACARDGHGTKFVGEFVCICMAYSIAYRWHIGYSIWRHIASSSWVTCSINMLARACRPGKYTRV